MKKIIITTVACASLLLTVGCGQSDNTNKNSATNQTNTKKVAFTIYNVAGMGEFNEGILLAKFKKQYADKYDVKYETLSANDVVTKIKAQGLQKGKGNINIVITGDDGMTIGNQAGVWSSFENKLSDINYQGLKTFEQNALKNNDYSGVPALMNNADPSIAYMPNSKVGKALSKVIGSDNKISYDELKDFLINSPTKPTFGRGLITTSGPGDYWTWGLLMTNGEYGANAEPTKSIKWAKDLYKRANVKLYTGTGVTFSELTEGSVDIIAEMPPWWARLAAKGKAKNLPKSVTEDTKGLENSKLALMTGPGIKPLASGQYYAIPANLSDEQSKASMDFIKFAIQPKINSSLYVSNTIPAYKKSTLNSITDENIKLVWNLIKKEMPAEDIAPNGEQILAPGTILTITNPAITAKYYKAWREQVEIEVSNK